MKILITGASGFIGGFVLSEALRRGHQVWALVRSQEPQEWQDAKQLEVLRCDLRRADTLDLKGGGIDVVLHMAAATRAGAAEHFQDTVMGTRNLLHAAREAGIHRIVGISSIAVLGYRSLQPMTVIDEAVAVTRGETLGVYATAKLQQEDLFLFFGHEGGNSCVILRPGLVYDQSRLLAAHAGVIRGRICLLAGHCGEVPTIEVHGAAKAIVNAAEQPPPGCEVIHLVDDHLPSQSEYIAGLRRRDLLPRKGIVIPWRVLRVLCGFVGTVPAVLGFDAKLPEVLLPSSFSARLKPFRYSNAKAKKLLNWSPGREFV